MPTDRPDECGEHYGSNAMMPHLIAVCTRPEGHEGDHDNLMPKGGIPND